MSIPSPERMAVLALKIAHEVYSGRCIDCGKLGVEMHEILGRTMRPILGSTVAVLGVTLAPLCASDHQKWATMSIECQLAKLADIFTRDDVLRLAQIEQLIALKSRAAVYK